MQTCSNCGSTSREGAKFCTTCGSRLNEVVDTTTANGWNSFDETDETRISTAVVADSDEATSEPDIEDAMVSEPPVTEELAASSSWSWGKSSDVIQEPGLESATPPDETPRAINDDSEALSSWAHQWSSPGDNIHEPAPEPEVAAESTPADDASDEVPAIAIDDTEDAAIVEDVPLATPVDVATPAISIPPLTLDVQAPPTPKHRAQALLYELRELIDESFDAPFTPAISPEGSVVSGDSGDALATLNAVQSDGGQFDNLRAILEKARSQPRDVDTMLNLLGEINALIALIDSHERYVDAVDSAKRQLA